MGRIARDFAKTDAAAVTLKKTLKDIQLLGGVGLALGGLGYAGLRVTESFVKPATEYAHQLNILNMAGLTHAEIVEAIGAAWKNTSAVISTTATQNLKSILDLRNVLGNMDEARMALPIVSRIQAVMASSAEGGIRDVAKDNFAFNMAKALDIVGAAANPQNFERQAEQMAKVITAFQGRVTPAMFQSVFAYSRQAKFGLSDDFKYTILPTLMLEYANGAHSQGGGSRGVGPALAAFSRVALQGYINRKSMGEFAALGLINPGSAIRTTTTGTVTDPLKGADLAASNPYLWVQQVLLPAIRHKFGGTATPMQVQSEVNSLFRGNQLAAQMVLEFALKQTNFQRDRRNILGAMPPSAAYLQAMRHDPNFAYSALAAQWENLKTAFGVAVIPILIPAIMKLSTTLNDFARWAEEHPNLAATITDTFMALSGALALSGMVLTFAAAWKAVKLVLGVGSLAPAALTTLGGTLGAVALGFSRLVGPLALIAGILALIGPRQGFQESQQDWMKKHKLSDESGWGDRLGAWWEGLFGSGGAPASAGTQASGAVADRLAAAIKSALNGTAVQMDGKVVGQIVTDHQGHTASQPPSGPSSFDLRQHPLYPTTAY